MYVCFVRVSDEVRNSWILWMMKDSPAQLGNLDTMLGLHLAEGCDEADEVPVFVNSLLNVCCQSHVWFRLEVIPGG